MLLLLWQLVVSHMVSALDSVVTTSCIVHVVLSQSLRPIVVVVMVVGRQLVTGRQLVLGH